VTQTALNGSRIDAVIRQFVTAAMPQHARMDFHVEAGRSGRAFHHGMETTPENGASAYSQNRKGYLVADLSRKSRVKISGQRLDFLI
jgi:hypothetical protein